MNEYNERILKNILQDSREETDEELLKEIEEAANNPLYQNKPNEAKEFAKKYGKSKIKKYKILSSVAAVLFFISIGVSVIPVNVEGRKNTLAELIVNYVNSEFFAVGTQDPLLTFEGKYVPTWIPDGYDVDSITNTQRENEIIFKNSEGKMIIYTEQSAGSHVNIDSAESENIKNIDINGFDAFYTNEDDIQSIIISVPDLILYITCNDDNTDLIGFAKLIEKR